MRGDSAAMIYDYTYDPGLLLQRSGLVRLKKGQRLHKNPDTGVK